MRLTKSAALLGLGLGMGCSDQTAPRPVASLLEPAAPAPIAAEVGSTVTLSVRVTTSAGAALAGVPVAWAAAPASGTIGPAASSTEASGIATTRWTLGSTPTEHTATAVVAGMAPVTFRVTPRAGPAVRLTASADSVRLFAVGDTVRLSASAADRFGNPIPDTLITWASLDTAVASVSARGTVRALRRGVGRLTATSGAAADTLRVYVLPLGVFTITFDDGYESAHSVAFPILRGQGLVGNVAINPVVVDERWVGYLTLPQMQELHAAGWSVVSHGVTHTRLTTLSDADLERELRESRGWIERNGFRGRSTFVVPYHEWGPREREAIRRYYRSARGVSATAFSPERYQPWPATDSMALTGLEPEIFGSTFLTAAGREELRARVARVVDRGEFVDVFFHRIRPEQVAAFRETVAVLAQFRARARAYHELVPD